MSDGFQRRREGRRRRDVHRLRGRPAALAGLAAGRAAAQRGGRAEPSATTRSSSCSTSPAPPPSPTTRSWPGCSRPPTPTTRRRPASSAASPRARCATTRPGPRLAVIDTLEEAGLPAELGEDGLIVDVELDRADAVTWMKSFTDIRLALATRLGVEDGRRGVLARAARRGPARARLRHLPVGGLPPGDARRRPVPLPLTRSQDADRAGARPAAGRPPPTLAGVLRIDAGDLRRDRRARQAGPPRRGVRRGRRARGLRPPGAVRPDGQRGALADVLRVRPGRPARGSTARWTTATRSRWWSTTRTRPPRPTRRAPTSGWRWSRTPTTCWSAHASTGIVTAPVEFRSYRIVDGDRDRGRGRRRDPPTNS